MNKPFIVAIVPAKMTSRRLPRKNLVDLCGNPLIYYSVSAAKLARLIDSVFVSSEDKEVLDIASAYGAQVIQRPHELSRDDVTNQKVLRHAMTTISSKAGREPDLVVLLQPTHPLRQPADIDRGITMMLDDPEADILFTLLKVDDLRGEIKEGRFITEHKLPRNKLSEPEMYRNCGSFYIFRPHRTFLSDIFFGKHILPMVLDRPEFEVDIDTASDLLLARCLLASNTEEFNHFNVNL